MFSLKNTVKNLIVGALETYIEDFTANDIEMDSWFGKISKENVKFKHNAFEGLFRFLCGSPVTIVQGYVKKLSIDVPWSKILS